MCSLPAHCVALCRSVRSPRNGVSHGEAHGQIHGESLCGRARLDAHSESHPDSHPDSFSGSHPDSQSESHPDSHGGEDHPADGRTHRETHRVAELLRGPGRFLHQERSVLLPQLLTLEGVWLMT